MTSHWPEILSFLASSCGLIHHSTFQLRVNAKQWRPSTSNSHYSELSSALHQGALYPGISANFITSHRPVWFLLMPQRARHSSQHGQGALEWRRASQGGLELRACDATALEAALVASLLDSHSRPSTLAGAWPSTPSCARLWLGSDLLP
jgi:hypothetical protein